MIRAAAEPGVTEVDTLPAGPVAMELPAPATGSGVPRTRREAVVRLGAESVGRVWKLAEFVSELDRRGWTGASKHDSARVIGVLTDLVGHGEVRKPAKGQYVFLPPARNTAQPPVRYPNLGPVPSGRAWTLDREPSRRRAAPSSVLPLTPGPRSPRCRLPGLPPMYVSSATTVP